MARVYRWIRRLLGLAGLLAIGLAGYALVKRRPQDLPWTQLDLARPVGMFTGRKLAALTQAPLQCRALLDRAGVAYTAIGARGAGQCAHVDALRLKPAKGAIGFSPESVAPSCPVVAALKLWEWHVVQPTAQRLYGQAVRRIDTLGSFNCRRMYGRATGDYSEHATADAIDIAGFVLADGRRVRMLADWKADGRDGQFLHAIRDGACGLFSTVLSPDYNPAHADHLHLDQAERGSMGWRVCR